MSQNESFLFLGCLCQEFYHNEESLINIMSLPFCQKEYRVKVTHHGKQWLKLITEMMRMVMAGGRVSRSRGFS
jgi:hypothetical protein